MLQHSLACRRGLLTTCRVGTFVPKWQLQLQKGQYSLKDRQEDALDAEAVCTSFV